jgi:NADPH-dependent 2,4-dienoyl-CoA reductase/sulfur reductase-like enzyme
VVAASDAGIVIVGASLAGLRAVEGARRAGYDGPITLVGAEPHLPYDRPPLSKDFLTAAEPPGPTRLRDEAVLRDELAVRLRLGTTATSLDVAAKAVVTDDGEVPYERLVIATGAVPRLLPGTESLRGVHALRTLDDAIAIRTALDAGARTVVVGAGFIGSEIAAAANKRGSEVTVVEALPTPLARAVGEQMGLALAALHERHGTRLRVGVGVDSLEHREGAVTGVRLADGTRVDADLVVIGIGVAPATGWLAGSGLELGDGIECDERLATSAPDVFAAGDLVSWPNAATGTRMRLEHWTIAAEQGGAAGRNAADPGNATPFGTVPYFWSDQYDKRIQFVGVAADADETRTVIGDLDSDSFLVLYRRGDRLIGVLGLEQRGNIMKFRNLLAGDASWSDAVALGAERAAAAAAKAAASAG